ncbi:quorum sensing histidine kinase QseC [Rhodocyclaceae bacterium]
MRHLLLLLISVVILLSWGIAAALTYRQARHEVQELMDGQMAQSAALLLAQATHAPEHLAGLAVETAQLPGADKQRNKLLLEFVISGSNGDILVRSSNSPASPPQTELGYANIDHAGERWRSLIMTTADQRYRIQVAQSIRLRDKEALEIATKTVMPLALFIPLLLGMVYWSVRRGLKPLDALAAQVATRSSDNLQALDDHHTPQEARPLVTALNRLLRRLGDTLDNERRFTADAAHELRTPLAAIKVQAQVAMASREAAQQHALQQVVSGTERATRLVEQLLRLARLDPLAKLPDPRPLDLSVLASELAEQTRHLMPERRDDIYTDIPDASASVAGNADLLQVALRNLLDNALRYSPPGTPVAVFAGIDHGSPVCGIRDGGPGVPATDLPRIIERFYRGRDTTAEGNGLGLAIVRRVAELHGARLEVENLPAGGFLAQLRWPAMPS